MSNSKKDIYELSVDDLIKLASKIQPAPQQGITDATEAAKFIYALNIRHGDARIPAQLIYYTYKEWKGWDNKPQQKPYFFRDFAPYFESIRTKDGIHYLLDPKPFDLSKETYWLIRKDIREQRAKPKKSRRNKVKNPALKKQYTPRVRQEYLDFDYLDQLNEEELEWLNKFTEEWLNASFNRDETDIQPYEIYGKDSNDRNNSRNRDLYGALKNKDNKFQNKKLLNYDNIVSDIENELSRDINPANIEDAYINFLESKEIEAMMVEYDAAMELFSEASEDLESLQLTSQESPELLKSSQMPESEDELSQHVLLPVPSTQ